jgi:hypothetical protein
VPAFRWIAPAAILVSLGAADVERAIKIAKSPDAERVRFHARYIAPLHVTLPDATLEQIEAITEFRRAQLDAEERLRQGDHAFTVRQVTDAIRPWRGKVTLALRLRFNPLNVLVSVPPYEIAVGEAGPVPLDVRRNPLYTLGHPGTASSLYGAVIEADFDAAQVGQTSREVRVILNGKVLARTTINFAQIE